MMRCVRNTFPWLAVVLLLGRGGAAVAQQPDVQAALQRLEQLERDNAARLEKLERENAELKRRLQQGSPSEQPNAPPSGPGISIAPEDGAGDGGATKTDGAARPDAVKKAVKEVLKEEADKKKKEDEEKKQAADAQGYPVGSDFSFKPTWREGLWFETPNRDFAVHLGGRLNVDAGWFSPSKQLNDAFPGAWQDGAEFRRFRLRGEGTMYEILNWILEVDFANSGAGTTNHPVPTDAYLEMTHLPVVGNVIAGHQKEPFSMEEYGTPDNSTLLMERSPATTVFDPARNIGLLLHNSALDEKVAWAAGVFRTNSDNMSGNAFDYGDGEYSYTGRLVFIPYYADEGRCWFLWGGAVSHRMEDPDDPGINGANPSRVRFAARIPIRVNSPFVIDTTNLVADGYDLFNAQAALVLGPFLIQAEYDHCDVHNDRRGALGPGDPRLTNPAFDGCYVMASYFLTGESHGLDRNLGRYTRVQPNEQFFWVERGEGGRGCCFGRGAWELVARYDYLDLGSGALNAFPRNAAVPGSAVSSIPSAGTEQDVTLGVNWYLATTARITMNYVHAFRSVPNPNSSGSVDALGVRLLYLF
jgi:phosphate-selective porin OprO/OprP